MYEANEKIVERRIHGSLFLINIADNYAGDRCALYEINQTGMFLWEKLKTKKTIEDLALLLKAEIVDDVDYQIILSDVNEFINALVEKGFVSEVA